MGRAEEDQVDRELLRSLAGVRLMDAWLWGGSRAPEFRMTVLLGLGGSLWRTSLVLGVSGGSCAE